ncbi:MAG: baseplate tail-tube junction protein, partial [Thermoproteota archaeon]|nr:baseplate tail-tube junction protein [Thermoproteota archaeon]
GNVGTVEKELIKIYLPALKSDVNENQSWEAVSSNDALTAAVTAFSEGEGALDSIGSGVGAGVNAMMSSMKIGAANLKASGTGFGVMEQQALKYNGPEQRGLTCTYNFVPRSEDETKVVHKIITNFRFHAAPKRGNFTDLSGDITKMVSNDVGVRTYKFPSLFKIKWLDNKGTDNKWLPKYNTCYCESVAVEYGDEKFTTFNNTSGAPTTYTLTLTFKELDYPTKERIDKDF